MNQLLTPFHLPYFSYIHLKMASIHLHVKPDFNYEEAAHAASDIVGSEPFHILELDK
jgi:hypothetical protein